MLALIVFAVVEEDAVDESAAAAVEDMEVLMTLVEAAVAAEALAAALRADCIFFCLSIIDLHSRKDKWRSFIFCKSSLL